MSDPKHPTSLIVDIPFRKIAGTDEWKEQRRQLRDELARLQIAEFHLQIEQQGAEALVPLREVLPLLRVTRNKVRMWRALEERGYLARPLCQERREDGRRCRFPAKEGDNVCKHHAVWAVTVPPMLNLPFPADAVGLQMLLARVIAMVATRRMTPEEAKVISEAARMMQKNFAEYERELAQAEEEFWL
jgi:hypothetical protein